MEPSYVRRFEKLSQHLTDIRIKLSARLPDSNGRTFTRNRKMPLKDIIMCCLAKRGLTTVFELRHYFLQRNDDMNISKQGYLQQRKRLNPDVFSALNDEYLMDFYGSDEVKTWNGYLVLAIDGSKAEVPNSGENRESFGGSGNQYSATGQVRALVSSVYDILNGFYLDMQIGHIANGETQLAKENLAHIREMGIKQPVLVIFDRGYPALEFIDFLEAKGIRYLFRLSSNDYKAERADTDGSDSNIILKHTLPRLNKIRRKHPEIYDYMSRKGETRTRLIRRTLPAGTELALITNLSEEFTGNQIGDLYYQRWEIEKKYHTLKNKLKLESVTGKASIYVYQDFRAQLLVYNMVQDIRRCADLEVSRSSKIKGRTHTMRTNENIAIGLFKEQMIKIVLEESPEKQARLLQSLQSEMEQYVLPIRDLPGHERKKNISNKYKNNQKHSF